jgi:acrylyl-CoA reductase (NADPH)
MPLDQFIALLVEEYNGQYHQKVKSIPMSALPEGEILINVKYSSLNYKDALSATGNKGVTRKYPHIPGIDAAGVVVESRSKDFIEGEEVIVTGHGLGMNTYGGFSEYIRVPAAWCLRLQEGLSLQQSMILGTAGLTAGLSILRLISHGVKPEMGPILVTGASGGVGSLAVAILSKLGYSVTASTGKARAREYLLMVGAREVVTREDVNDLSGKALLKERWAGVVDSVGGNILVTALKSTRYGMAVTCCGLVASAELVTSVYPFILRGITLYGIDSAECESALRKRIWDYLAGEWKPDDLSRLARTCKLKELPQEIENILKGELIGRVVVRI